MSSSAPSVSSTFPEMLQNPDRRPLPPGCVTHLDSERRQWYYVHLQKDPPLVTFIHPADETPSSSHNSYFPARSSTPQQHPSSRQSQRENSPPQHPPRVSPTYASPTAIMQNPTVQQQPSYENRSSFGQITSSMQDYTSRQQQNPSPPVNMNHARHLSAQSLYGTSIPQTLQTPSDNSRFSIYSTNSHGTAPETEFDASILYSSPVSASPTSAVPVSSPAAVSQILQPQRRRMTLDDSFTTSPSNQTTHHPRAQSIQVSNPATRFQPHNVLRRKTKTAAALAAISPISQPPTNFQQSNEVPVYSLVAQAPLDTSVKPTTPSFQMQLYSKPPAPSSLPASSSNSGLLPQITPLRTQSLPPITTSNQQGLLMTQYPSSAPTTTTSGSTTIPQQPLSPLRAQNTGGTLAIPYTNSQIPSLMQTTSHSTLGIMGAPLNATPSLMSMSSYPQLDGFSNGMTGLPMSSIPPMYNQPQTLMPTQLNGTMTVSGAPLASATLISPQPLQHNSLSNGLLGNNSMAQASLSVLPPQQPNVMSNGYAPGSGTLVQGGMIGQSPGVVVQPIANSGAQTKAKDNKNKQLMKKVGRTFGKAVFKLGAKYALEQIGIDGAEE